MRTRGFTLIELMVSMALFGLIAAGAMTLVLSGARTQAHSSRVDVAQSSLRAAIDFITRDVMVASAGASSGSITLSGPTVVNAIDLTGNNLSGSPYVTASDKLELYNVDGTTAAQINTAVGAAAMSLPITYEANTVGQFTVTMTPFHSFVQVSDLTTAVVTQLNGASATALTVAALPSSFAANAYVLPSRHVVYYVSDKQFGVADATLQNASMLMMKVNDAAAQPLAEGVEDLQIAYGFDNNADGVVTENGTAAGDDEWLFNAPGETVGTWLIANLRTVRVTIVAKSTSVDTGQRNLPARPAAEDHLVGTVDGFVRRVLRTEIAVRNFNL